MLEIEKPKISILESKDNGSYGKVCIEPLERGLGTTIGNALRRTLISSLPGMAITTIQIEGVQHEFSTIEGVKEDSTDLVLAFKSVKLKCTSRDIKFLRIEKEGPCVITAGDIVGDSEITVLNPDLHIATLEKGAKFFVELRAETSRGFVIADENKRDDLAIGEIPIDSLFSPVLRVNYEVKDKRIGNKVDHDTLNIDIKTDGSITIEEALKGSANILIAHLELFNDLSESDAAGVPIVEKEDKKLDQLLLKPIEDLDLSVRPFNCLKRAGINTMGDLINQTELEVMRVKNLGKKSLDEIHDKVREAGLKFREVDDE